MVTPKDVEEIHSKLTEDQWKQFVYYVSKDHLHELKELARKKCKVRFVRVMRRLINKFLRDLENNNKCKRVETINLLMQANKTLKNVYKHTNNYEIVDACILLRSTFENVIIGMMINESDNVYNEFIDLSIDDTNRKYTKPQKLRNDFRRVLRKLDGDYFVDISNKNLKDMLDEFYDKLCSFAHSTLIVNAMIEIEKDDDLDIYVVFLKQYAYFVEYLLYLCLKKLCNCKSDSVDIMYAIVGCYILISDIPKEKMTQEKADKLKVLLHEEFNKEYFEKNKWDVDFLIDESKKLQKDLYNNPLGFVEILEKIVK